MKTKLLYLAMLTATFSFGQTLVTGVTVEEVSSYEVAKGNDGDQTIDGVAGTIWTSNDAVTGDNLGDGEYVIYDLNGTYALEQIDITTNIKTDAYGFQVFVSTDNVTYTQILDGTTYIFTTPNSDAPTAFTFPAVNANYVKLVGFGRFSDTTNGAEVKSSDWITVDEISFYGDAVLSTQEFDSNAIAVYPVPAQDVLNLKTAGVSVDNISIYSLDGRLVTSKDVENSNAGVSVNTASLTNGTYLLKVTNASGLNQSRLIVVSH